MVFASEGINESESGSDETKVGGRTEVRRCGREEDEIAAGWVS